VTLIDMGLATPFSKTSAKLSTCCGSPAFHSPEIVRSLSRPAGEIHYWGPEVDAWCIALSVLRCWTGRRYPLGIGHKALSVMRGRVEDVLALVSRDVMDSEDEVKRDAERELRETLRGLLDFDGGRRMQVLRDFDVGDDVRESIERFQRPRECALSMAWSQPSACD
jgi:serine/threonine protein kinase